MGAQVGGVVPPSQPPQLIPNGNAGQQQPTGLGFVIPTVDTAHSNHMPQAAYRSAPRNLPYASYLYLIDFSNCIEHTVHSIGLLALL